MKKYKNLSELERSIRISATLNYSDRQLTRQGFISDVRHLLKIIDQLRSNNAKYKNKA